MVIENDPSARIKVISVGMLMHPGTCAVCGNGTCESGYVDLGVYYDYEGNVYLCMTCAVQIGETVGLYTPEEVKHTQDIADRLAIENAQLWEEVNDTRPIIESLSRVLGVRDHTDFRSALSGVEVSSEPAEVTAESVSGTNGGESGSEEPTLSVGRRGEGSPPKLRDITFD